MKKVTYHKNNITLEVIFSVEENTVWLSQADMAILFSRSIANISLHLKNIGPSLKSNLNQVFNEDGRKINHYNLDIITKVGYKIDPVLTAEFVNWCNEQLKAHNNQLIPIESNIIRFTDNDISLNVNVSPKEQTVWLTQNDMVLLFDTTQQNISLHIVNIIKDDELVDSSVHKESLYTALDGKGLQYIHKAIFIY